MIIEKNKFEIVGNTVLAPGESFSKRNYEDLEKSRAQIIKRKKLKDIKKKKSVILNIILCCIIGISVVARYSMIYNYQNITLKAKAEIKMLNKENEDYKVKLIKFKNISYIEKIAIEKLNMVNPRISDIEYCDLSKNNLETKEISEVKISNNILNKIKSFIF